MTSDFQEPSNVAGTSNYHEPDGREEDMAQKGPELGVPLLRDLLGLTSNSRPNSPEFRPPIFISIPTLSSKKKTDLPLTLSIFDLLDLSHLPPQNILTTHTFTTKLALWWTNPAPSSAHRKIKTTPILVTKSFISLEHLLPQNRDLVFVSTGVGRDLRPVSSLLRSLGMNAKTKVVGIFDVDMLAKDIVALDPPSSSIPAILQGLEEKAGNGCEETEFVMRAMLLLVLESCKGEVRDEIGRTWVEGLRAVGTGMEVVEGPMEVVRKGVKKVGKAIMGGIKRSGEEIERVRAERRKKRQDVGASEEYVTEMRLWDGMWELL
jgi:hypothetical protein